MFRMVLISAQFNAMEIGIYVKYIKFACLYKLYNLTLSLF